MVDKNDKMLFVSQYVKSRSRALIVFVSGNQAVLLLRKVVSSGVYQSL